MDYSLQKFETDIQSMERRPFDKFILPAFTIWYAIASKKAMGRKARRVLFIAGVYMGYRSYADYKKLAMQARALIEQQKAPA